jgi:hypothetical protein
MSAVESLGKAVDPPGLIFGELRIVGQQRFLSLVVHRPHAKFLWAG